MEKTALLLADSGARICVGKLRQGAEIWYVDCEMRQLSRNTVDNRRFAVDKLLWFLEENGYDECGILELKKFFAYFSNGHEDPKGRWGNRHLRKCVRPRTVQTYYISLRTFFRFLVDEGLMDTSPMESIKPPVSRPDQVQPFTEEQVDALLQVAKRSTHPKRDEAILLFLLDTGVRASELCALRMTNLDMEGRRCRVLGKGNKQRSVCFGRVTMKALWQYIREKDRENTSPVFASDRGTRSTEPLTRYGLLQLVHRLGRKASIQSARCSPHTFRHTFAVEFLRGGGNVFTLKELLGHTSLTIVNRYVQLAQADIENQHRQFSPADRLRSRNHP